MSLPRSARRLTIVVMRPVPTTTEPLEDAWGRTIRAPDPLTGDPPEVLRTKGDIQSRVSRGRSGGEVPQSNAAGPVVGSDVGFTDVLDIRAADFLRIEPDDGLRYNVIRVDRPGIGRRLDHLELALDLITSGYAAGPAGI